MNRLLTLLSMANFIAAGVFFLLGSLQSAVPSEPRVADARVAAEVENSQETVAGARNGLPPVETGMRTEPQAVTETGSDSSSVSLGRQNDRPRSMAETEARDSPEPGAGNLPVLLQDQEHELVAEPSEKRPEPTESAMRNEDVDEPEPKWSAPEERQARIDGGAGLAVTPASTDSTQVNAEQFEEVFTLSEESYASGAYLLSGNTLRRIDFIAARAAEGKHRIVVEGHADAVPVASSQRIKYGSNQELSLLRASVVAERLIISGIDPSRITVLGYGDSRPVASNLTPEGRAMNRRVEVRLVPDSGPAIARVSTQAASVEGKTGD